MKPSTRAVLDLLRERGDRGLTDLEALDVARTTRLAARVWELRALGYDVRGEYETTASGKRIARYRLHEQPVQLDLFSARTDALVGAGPRALPPAPGSGSRQAARTAAAAGGSS